MSRKWKCVCGKESSLSENRCPNCGKPLSMYGTFVTDEQEPELSFRPYSREDSEPPKQVAGKKAKPQKEAKVKERQHREPKEKKGNGAGKTVLILVLFLVILCMGAVIALLLNGIPALDSVPPQPTVVQTDPPATNPPATNPPATNPPATEPPATNPPATEPPATNPPATEPPATNPPATEPPATEPPATEPVQTTNFLKATIWGEEVLFQLHRTTVTDRTILVYFMAKNPRGEERYYISVEFNKNYTVGTYQTTGNILYTDVKIKFVDYAIGTNEDFNSYRKHGDKTDVTGTLVIEKMSDDWMTYDGSFNVELQLYGKDRYITIDDAVFNFTLQGNS